MLSIIILKSGAQITMSLIPPVGMILRQLRVRDISCILAWAAVSALEKQLL